jgi:SAM-dependent methyltransferase
MPLNVSYRHSPITEDRALNPAAFDQFADEYQALHHSSTKVSGEPPEYFARYKVDDVRRLWQPAKPAAAPPVILDFGAGVANSLPHFRSAFPDSRIICLDVSPRSLEIAASRFPRQAEFVCFDGKTIPLPAASVTIAFTACVFHHVDHAEHVSILRELRRVVEPGGMAILFEHNPFNPLTRHAVHTCPFDADARLITARAMKRRFREAGFSQVTASYRIFFPGWLRRLRPLERWLTWCPLGAQYRVVGRPVLRSVETIPSSRRAA